MVLTSGGAGSIKFADNSIQTIAYTPIATAIPFTITAISSGPFGTVTEISNSSKLVDYGGPVPVTNMPIDITLTFTMTAFTNDTQFMPVSTFGGLYPPDQTITAICSLTNTDNVVSFGMASLGIDNVLSLINVSSYPQTPTPITVQIHMMYLTGN